MPEDPRLRKIARLIEELESEDAFVRREAIDALHRVTKRRLGFPWRGSEADRAASVRRWRRWLDGVRREKEAAEVQAALQHLGESQAADPSSPAKIALSQSALAAALEQIQQAGAAGAPIPVHILAAMQKLAASEAHPVCEQCGKRPATVSVTRRGKKDVWAHRVLCEVCVQTAG